MGLASSQARLLLLTARKSDLEYRSQMISQRKIMLAMDTESLATEYTRGLSNRRMKFVFETDPSKGTTLTEDLNYDGVTATNSDNIGHFIVTDAMNRLVVPANSKLPEGFVADAPDPTTGKVFAYYQGSSATLDKATAQKFEVLALPDVNNATVFQNSLRNGGLYLQKLNPDENKFEPKALTGIDVIQDQLDTTDDAAAQSVYETKSLTVQNQDKILDLELKQIETQHKAIETEYDSVKKVIDKNIEVSYKIFANG